MARLYRFQIKHKLKSLEEILTQESQDGLSKTIHKGFLAVTLDDHDIFQMHFFATHPLKIKIAEQILAYSYYPDNKVVFYPIRNII